jgi:hypothetical protein
VRLENVARERGNLTLNKIRNLGSDECDQFRRLVLVIVVGCETLDRKTDLIDDLSDGICPDCIPRISRWFGDPRGWASTGGAASAWPD